MMQAARDGLDPAATDTEPGSSGVEATSDRVSPNSEEVSPPNWLKPARDRVVTGRGGLLLWRIAIGLLGGLVVVLGVVLLPLPGPGWAIIFGGMAIWATEFAWARRLLTFAKATVSSWTSWALKQSIPVRILICVLGITFLLGVLYVGWLVL